MGEGADHGLDLSSMVSTVFIGMEFPLHYRSLVWGMNYWKHLNGAGL